MTAVNVIAGIVYTKGFPLKDKLQLYGIAALFLVLLYNSPSALVLYWTCNNIFSLGKNIVAKITIPKKLLYIAFVIFVIIFDSYLLFAPNSGNLRAALAVFLLLVVIILPIIYRFIKKLSARPLENHFQFRSYLVSCITLFLLAGFAIPSQIISSSVSEFSFIDSFTSPYPLLLPSVLQSLGIFIFWCLILYALFSPHVRAAFSFFALFFVTLAIVNTFLINENFGFLTNLLVFSEVKPFGQDAPLAALSVIIPIAACAIVFALWKFRCRRVIWGAQCVALMALIALCAVNTARIGKEYAVFLAKKDGGTQSTEAVYTFSKNDKNVLLIMLDAVSAGYVPYIFEEKSELLNIFKDFTFYPNTISYANHTLVGALPLYGGYEYTPEEVNARRDIPLLDKQQEAYLLLPTLFADAGFSVTVTDPPFYNHNMSNLSIFQNDRRIHAENVIGKYTSVWRQNHRDVDAVRISKLLYERFIRFSFFKISPLFMRTLLYDDGDYLLLPDRSHTITPVIIDDYAFLDMLKNMTNIKESGGTYQAIYSHLTHESALFATPEYTPRKAAQSNDGFLQTDGKYHTIMASFLLLYNYFEYLKEADIYDNTRIILAADHGGGSADYPQNITLPNGNRLSSYNPLLMVKDFFADSPDSVLHKSFDFMTNADVPFFALDGIIDSPHNPLTGALLTPHKKDGADIVTIGALNTHNHSKYAYNIRPNQWLHVRDDVFEAANWSH